MAAVPPPLPPLPGADAAPTQPRRKRTKKGDSRDVPGAVVHALAHNIMGRLIVGNLAQGMHNGVSKCDGIFLVNQENNTLFYGNTHQLGQILHHPSPTYADSSMYVTAKPCGGRPPTCRMRWELPSIHQLLLLVRFS
eukprot:scaffold5929_cov101-Skeletonema_dohrnii-CCMP3373.AAC.8